MAFPNLVVGDLVLITLRQQLSVQAGEVTCGMACSAVTGLSQSIKAVAQQMYSEWTGSGLPIIASDSVTFTPAKASLLDKATGFVLQVGVSSDTLTVGQDSLGLAPGQVSPVVRKTSQRAGRSGRGRLFHPFLLVSQLDNNGHLLPGISDSISVGYSHTFGEVIIGTAPDTCTLVPVIIHRSPLPLTFTPIDDILCTGLLGTQRRRGQYGRPNP